MKLLIANRGEIALRVIRACRKLGIVSIAVYSDQDKEALHVKEADEAYLLGPAPSKESYLNQKKILEIAKKAKAKLIHPGYGFLAENSGFAKACEKQKLLFVGPSSKAIALLGDKLKAKQLAEKCGLSILSGTEAQPKNLKEFKALCQKIKFPIMIKAVGGGGGKGIRIVHNLKEAETAFERAASEAQSAFKNAKLYLEPYLKKARHIEIQVIADAKGNILSLGERECSIQRRFQKLIEESPSPFVTPALRAKMETAAKAIFKAAQYVNAGTVEFLVDSKKNFYFLEVNTRIQVEHPVTEMVYGVDLVVEQINIALGKKLSLKPKSKGYAIELRLCAEDPSNQFYPSTGTIDYLKTPIEKNCRFESSLYLNMPVSLHYDSLLAKLIVFGKTRKETLLRTLKITEAFHISGIQTNLPFLRYILKNKEFQKGAIHTQFVEEHLIQSKQKPQAIQAALSALFYHLQTEKSDHFKLHSQKKSKWQQTIKWNHGIQSLNQQKRIFS